MHQWQPSKEVLDGLRQYDTATICNAIELFEIQLRTRGWIQPPLKAVFPALPPTVGFAVTATFKAMSQPAPAGKRVPLHKQVEAFEQVPKPWIVVIQDLDDPPLAAVFGEVMVSTYRGFGAVGLVTNGYARDLAVLAQLDFPCWATGRSPSHAWPQVVEVMIPVTVGGLQIRPGDLLHGDGDGVTSIPPAIVDLLPEACEEFVAAEKVVISEAQSHRTNLKTYEAAFQEFARRRQAITDRLKMLTAGRPGGTTSAGRDSCGAKNEDNLQTP
jgi:regulator of RNase E activity RraA